MVPSGLKDFLLDCFCKKKKLETDPTKSLSTSFISNTWALLLGSDTHISKDKHLFKDFCELRSQDPDCLCWVFFNLPLGIFLSTDEDPSPGEGIAWILLFTASIELIELRLHNKFCFHFPWLRLDWSSVAVYFSLATFTWIVRVLDHPLVKYAIHVCMSQHILVHGVVPSQVQDFEIPFVKFHEGPVSPFLQFIQVLLVGSMTL